MPEGQQQERFEFVLRWLERRQAHVAAAIIRLGQVRMSLRVATAAIVAQDRNVWLYFNPEFFTKLDNAELAAALTHEALHFFLAHPKRIAAIPSQRDRFYFGLACEAVVNDLILANFKEMKLPGTPVTGRWLVGQDTSGMSAEQVMLLLWRDRAKRQTGLEQRLASAQTIDDHSSWETCCDDSQPSRYPTCDGTEALPGSDSLPALGRWTEETSDLVVQSLEEITGNDPCIGTITLGKSRFVQPARTARRNLAHFLADSVSTSLGYETLWTFPNRKLLSVYPQIILPTYEPLPFRNILMAIDTSGSVPDCFISAALAFAQQRTPQNRITLVSFDTVCYEAVPKTATLRGGGGTRAQAVEEFIKQKLSTYPDLVFLMTDGHTPPSTPQHPERWIWLLPRWGTARAVPKGSTAEFFDAQGMAVQRQRSIKGGALQAPASTT